MTRIRSALWFSIVKPRKFLRREVMDFTLLVLAFIFAVIEWIAVEKKWKSLNISDPGS
jgi:hypothetical protein